MGRPAERRQSSKGTKKNDGEEEKKSVNFATPLQRPLVSAAPASAAPIAPGFLRPCFLDVPERLLRVAFDAEHVPSNPVSLWPSL
jgi:hypothetical protein